MSLEPAQDWKKFDTTTSQYKRHAVVAILVCTILGAMGGLLLGYKISAAEQAHADVTPEEVQAAKDAAAKRMIRLRERKAPTPQ